MGGGDDVPAFRLGGVACGGDGEVGGEDLVDESEGGEERWVGDG